MATGFPFGDRRQRPCVMGLADAFARPAPANGLSADRAATSQDHIDPARACARGRSYVDIATVPGGASLPHRDVLG